MTHRPFIDRTSAGVPDTAIAAFTLVSSDAELDALIGRLPEPLNRLKPGQTAYAVSGATSTEPAWSVVSEQNDGPHSFRLIRKEVAGYGFIRSEDAAHPIELETSPGSFRMRVGRGFRGISAGIGTDAIRRNAITTIPSGTSLFYADRNPARSIDRLGGHLGETKAFLPPGFTSLFMALNGPTEAVFLEESDRTIRPFLIHSVPGGVTEAPVEAVEAALREIIGQADPHVDTIALPDGSITKELRSSAKDVAVKQHEANSTLTRNMTSHQDKAGAVFIRDAIGHLWIGDSVPRLQEVLLANSGSPGKSFSCTQEDSPINVLIYPQNMGINMGIDWLDTLIALNFKAIGVSINDLETELFTLCGYANELVD